MLDTAVMTMWSKANRGEPIDVRFIRPAIATFLACARIARSNLRVQFEDNPGLHEYAERSGLNHALAGNQSAIAGPRRVQQGVTWSPLTTLCHHAEIDICNQTINDLLFAQLSGVPRGALSALARVVGELHDNIASHANGRGFSAAQYYPSGSGYPAKLELSVADAGWGFLRNVKRARPDISTHAEAIRWCLQKGNTAGRHVEPARPSTEWVDPYSDQEGGSGQRDHHMGYGLWLLTELVRSTGGDLWIWSGDSSYTIGPDGQERVASATPPWPGVIISLTFYPTDSQSPGGTSEGLRALAEELGL